LQIIDDDTFARAQMLMKQRTNEYKESRTVPLRTSGMSLLSGNIFCGHCGSRLTLTTNGKVEVRKTSGERVKYVRIRYVCYGKTRRKAPCDGQTGYTAHIVDEMVEAVIKGIFDRMKRTPESAVLSSCNEQVINDLDAQLRTVKTEHAKAAKELEALQTELVKVVMGQSELPRDILTKMINGSKAKLEETDKQAESLKERLDNSKENLAELKKQYSTLLNWSQIYDGAEMSVKKMIAAYMIQRVDVFRGYELRITLNMDIRQFMEGLDIGCCINVDSDGGFTREEGGEEASAGAKEY
jgi:hypothetical protein